MAFLTELLRTSAETIRDVLPIVAILTVFQLFVLRKKLPDPRRIVIGFVLVRRGTRDNPVIATEAAGH